MKSGEKNSYQLIDSGHFMKLEQVGPYRIVRPSPSAVWEPTLNDREWKKIDAEFKRYTDGNGDWKVVNEKIKQPWTIDVHGITFNLKLTGFGHLGIFAEQQKNWLQIREIVSSRVKNAPMRSGHDSRGRDGDLREGSGDSRGGGFSVLNLFAYTGGSTLFAAAGGAEVIHLDASKSSVQWARDNAKSSGLENRPVRWIVDDVQEFVKKEVRRGKKYQGIILDPPSYGRGAKNQIWKIEEHLIPLLQDLRQLMADDFAFLLLSGHSPGYTPVSFENQLRQACRNVKGKMIFDSGEMVIIDQQGQPLPSGAYSFMRVE